MKLKRIYIDQFGKHNSLLINFENNFNLLIGPNESGKSTLLTFILTAFMVLIDIRRDVLNEMNECASLHGAVLALVVILSLKEIIQHIV